MWVPDDASLMGSLENLKRPEITTAREGKLCITFKIYAQMTTRGQIMNNVLSRRFIKHAIHFTEKGNRKYYTFVTFEKLKLDRQFHAQGAT